MSGLTSYYYYEDMVITPATHQYRVYHADEADKVIADKDAKILALDAEVVKQKHHAKLFFDERNYAETQLRHQKYKRCLINAKWCDTKADWYYNIGLRNRCKFYMKWRQRWLELAKKFKEAK